MKRCFKMYSKIVLFLLVQLIAFSSSQETIRTLDATLNPGCPTDICDSDSKIITLIHITADGTKDTVHFLWDFTGKPTVMMAVTPLNTEVFIDWHRFMQGENSVIKFSQNPSYTGGMIINRLWQFNDAEDKASIPMPTDNSTGIIGYDTYNITWVRADFVKSANSVEVTVAGDNAYLFGDGKIKLKLKCFGVRDHDDDFPHLLHSNNMTQVDFVMDALRVNESWPNARYAAEMVLVASEDKSNKPGFVTQKRKSLDDEHTPGIFELIEIASPKSYVGGDGSFIQYRPVSYTHPERDVSTSTELHITIPGNLDNPAKQLNTSLVWSYYGFMLDEILVQGFNVSFGLSEDGFYAKTNYNTWTFVMGYGSPPNEQLSMFVVIVASIGLGLPLLLMVGGGCYVCIRRVRNR